MEERIFPPSPTWCYPNIISSREDGSVCYGSRNNIVILFHEAAKNSEINIINNNAKITSVAFSPSNCSDPIKDSIASSSDDGMVKLWKVASLSAFLCHKSHSVPKDSKSFVSLDWNRANPHQIFSVAENSSLVLWEVISNTTKKYQLPIQSPTVVSCCPFNEKLVAVGSKSGKIFLIDSAGSGSIVFKLRGHDNKIHSLSWCPVPYNIFNIDELHEEFLLASACQDKEVLIWRAGSDGKCEAKFIIPTSSFSKKNGIRGKSGLNFSFSALLWFDPYRLFSSSNFGELIFLDIESYLLKSLKTEKGNKSTSSFFKLGHLFHSKTLVALAGQPMKCHVVCCENIKTKSLNFKIESNNCDIIYNNDIPNETGSLGWRVVPCETVPILWSFAQDRLLVGCKVNSHLEMVYNYHTLGGAAYSAVASPHDPNKIAIGVGDGMIRLWNLTSNENIEVYWQKIKDRVMSLAWHPTKDGLLAYGTSEGRVGLIDTNSKKLPSVFKPFHASPVYNLSWGPKRSLDDNEESLKPEYCIYCIGNNKLFVYNPLKLNADPLNLSKTISFPCKKQTDVSWKPDYSLMAVGNDDGSICLVDSTFKLLHTVHVHKKMIQSIAWHPPSTLIDSGISNCHGLFTTGSTDNRSQILVFNCNNQSENLTIEVVATLSGHHRLIQSVCWSPHTNGRLVSCSADLSVQIWDVFSQSPLVNFAPRGTPMFSIWSPIDPDIIVTGCREDFLTVWRVSVQTKVSPTVVSKPSKRKLDKDIEKCIATVVFKEENESVKDDKSCEESEITMAVDKADVETAKEPKMFPELWSMKSEKIVQNCFKLLKENNMEDNFSLLFLCDDKRFAELLSAEEEKFKKTNSLTEQCELSLWSGNFKEDLEEKIKTGHLNDYLVSLAPVVSPRVWQDACLSYSKTLADKQLFRKAASYLIACRKVYDAIELLANAKLFFEALCIARSRLPKSDPVFKNLIGQCADWFFKSGSLAKACECYIYLENYLEVAKICGKTKNPVFLHLAALAANKCGQFEVENLEAASAVLECIKKKNFVRAKKICDDLTHLKYIQLLHDVSYTMHHLNKGELTLTKDIISYIKESFGAEDVIFPSTLTRLYNKYTFYKNKDEMLTVVAQELSFACSAKNRDSILIHIIQALSACCRYTATESDVHPLFSLCCWLSPGELLSTNGYFSIIESDSPEKVKSLRAFLCAGISKIVSQSKSNDVLSYLSILSEVKDDLLDKPSYKYFKNLLEVEACQGRLVNNRCLVNKMKCQQKVSDQPQKNSMRQCLVENDKGNETNCDKEKFSESVNSVGNTNTRLSENSEEEEFSELVNSVGNANSCLSENSEEENNSSATLEELEEKIVEDIELLRKLNSEIENFETVRISSPNPVPVYFVLKQSIEKVSENKLAKVLLEALEERWNDLN